MALHKFAGLFQPGFLRGLIKNNFDQVLIDTAGRLQNKKNLMEEYKKIANVTKKIEQIGRAHV